MSFCSPNPSSDVIHIQDLAKQFTAATIFHVNGHMVQQITFRPGTLHAIPVDRLPQGSYILRLEGLRGLTATQAFVVSE